MATLDQLRALFPDAESDADLIRRASKDFGIDPAEISSEVGYKVPKGGLTSQQFSSSIDRYQAGLYGVGEEVAKGVGLTGVSKYLRGNRQENEFQADIASERARELGAVDEWKNVRGIGDFGSYAKGLAIQSVPYAAEALVGGIAARGAMTGTRAALTAAETAGDVAAASRAKKALNIGSTVGGTAASYPSSVGDVLSNQREQSPTGETRGGVAAALGIPYAALNAVGVESALMRGNLFKNSINLLDKGTGLTGAAARTAATATGVGLKEGASETGQEMINQLGRMSVDKSEQFFSDAAQERFKESFIGGAVLGGVAGGTLGGWRRSGNDVSQAISSRDQTNPPITTQQFTPPPAPPALSAGVMAGLTGRGADPLAGRSKLIGGEPAPAPAAPAVAGGSTDIAQAQQQAQIESQQIQKAQAQQAAREQIYTNFGIADPTNPTKGNLFGKPLFGPSVPAVADAIGAATRTMSAYQLEVAQAVNKANADTGGKLLNFQFNANDPTKSVQKAMEAVGKVANAFQISHVQTVEEAAQILNEQSNTLKGAKLEQLNAIHQALTGEDTSGYLAEQQSKTAKGAKNAQQPKLQTTTGLGTVPVQSGTREDGGGDLGNVQPSGLQSLLSGSQPQKQTSQQIGQPSGEGIRTGTSVTPDLSNGQPTSEQVNVQAANQNGGGQVSSQPQQAAPSAVGERPVQNGPRIYATPPQYYATDLSHIKGSRRIEVILDLLNKALAPKVTRKGVAQSAERVEMLRLALLEQFEAKEIAKLTGMTEASVQKQLERLGVNFDRDKGQWGVTDLEFAKTLVDTATVYRSVEFPDGIGEQELAALYATKYTSEDTAENQLEVDLLGEETKPEGSKLQEELGTKEKPEAQSMGVVDTFGGSQGAVDTSGDAFFAKVGKLQAELELASDAEKPAIQKKIEAAWTEYGKDQTKRGKTGEIEVKPSNEGEEDAVQEQGADEGDVRQPAGGGEEVGKTNAKPKKPAGARKAKPEVKPVEEVKKEVKTPEEQWKALADQFPGMPPYEGLTKDEKIRWDDVASRGVANLAAANTVLTTTVKAGTTQAPSITGDAKTLAPEVEKLTEGQTTRLEQHYGAQRGTDDFFTKLGEDVVAYASKGAEAVSAAIRDIIRVVAQGVLAAAIVVNPTLAKVNFQFNLPRVVSQTTEVRAAVPDVAKAKMSEAAQVTYSAVAPIAKQANKAFMIVDKVDGQLHVFHSDGNPILQAPSLLGGDVGDTLQGGKKITPAGKFTLKFTADPEYYGGFRYDLVETQQVDGIIAIHAVYTGEASEKRPERLATPTPTDNRISWGCINVTNENMVNTLIPAKNELNGSLMFVMPENSENIAQLFPAMTQTIEATEGTATGKAEIRSVVGKEENMLFGKDNRTSNPYTADELTKDIRDFIRADIVGRKLLIVDSISDLLASSDPAVQKVGAALSLEGAYGVATNGRAYLIANRIKKGTGRAKFMHEVGAHLGLENLLPKATYDRLIGQLKSWVESNENTNEVTLAARAKLRVEKAGTSAEDQDAELLAYFIEEAVQAGIDPTAAGKESSAFASWFRTLWAAFKTAVRRLGLKPESMTAQDIVDLAFGAARLEMAGTYHGTAAEFRRFNHKYMGSGEGAQAYGWGTYLAQRVGIAKGYWKADVRRKVDVDPNKGNPLTRFLGLSPLAKPEGNVMRVDIGVGQNELLNWDTKLSKQPAILAKAEANIPESLKQSLVDETNLDLNEMTGEDLYRGLEFLEKKEGRVSEEFDVADYNKRLANKKAKELVSTYLDEVVGIPGLKFYDAESRNAPENEIIFKGKQYKREDLIDMRGENAPIPLNQITILRHVLRNGYDETIKELERKFERNVQASLDVKKETYAKFNTTYDEAKAREEITQRYQKTYEGEQIKFLKDNKDNISVVKGQGVRTRNLVIFNDKNIFRVGSRGGNERANMKFGSTEQKPPRLEKRENGRVIDLIVDGQTAESFELASKGLWDRFGGDEEKILRGNDAQTAKEKAYKALRSAEYAYRQEGPLNRVEQIALDDLERGDLEGLRARMPLLFDGGQLRYNIGKLISHAVYNPDTPLDANAPEAKYAPKWVLGQEARPAQPTEEISIGTRRAPTRRDNMKFGIDAVLPAAATKPAKSVVTNIATAARNGLLSAGITEDVVNMASKYMRSAKDYLDAQYARQKTRLDFEMRIERILENFDKLPKNLQGIGAGSVNRYILDSTMQRKWGYYPGEERIGTQLFEADPDLAARFDAFPDDAQQLIKDVFEHGYTALDMKKTAVSKAVEREFAERERAAIGDVDALADLQKERKAMVAKLSRLQNIDFTVPYAYLGRYGDYIVVAKSKEFKHWQERAQLNDFDVKQAKAWLSDNSSNPDHYVVQFAETQGEADQLAAELIATGKFDMDGTEAGPKEAAASYIGDDLHLAVSRARNLANRQKGEGSEELDKLLGDLYLLTAAENSARKSEIARKYVYGANENMMRNLATSGRADAHFLSTMEHNDAITESLEKMRDEARRNYKEAMPLYNELYTRQANSMDYKQPALLSQALTQATSLWFLSTSPAFYLQQILQTGVLSLPYMAGRLGYFRSARAIKTAYGDVAGLIKGLGVSEHVDFSKAPADVRGMLETLVGMGKIDIGIDSDARSRAGEQGTLGKVIRKLQGVNNRIETINRATAAIAAYRGYLQRFGANNTDAATKFAAEVVSNSHGSYDGFNTPRILNSDIGRVVGQFKRFQIIQLSMLAKVIHTAFKGASAEEKMVARRTLAFITGHMAVLGGALGVPFVMQIGNLLTNLFGDDDEPKDFEYKLRQAIGDKALADLLLNGVPAAMGVNLGGKLGMGNVASILPFTDVDLSSRSGYEKVMVGMMGPFFGGLAPKFIDGAGMITKGEYYKGLELMMPNGIGNAMKGVRFATEGITMRNGDVVMKPEDISIVDAAFQAVGLPTTTITSRQYTQKTKVEFDKFYADKAAEIKSAYVDANRDGDSAGMSDARKDWENLQESRRRNKYKIQPMSELFMAVSAASKRQRSVVNGVETTKTNKQFVANII